jgi:mannitol-1-phosphate 5-dehydrogenase
MKTAIQFGAGNIGRGFMGQLFFEAGYQTIFVEAFESLVDMLNNSQAYPLRILDAASQQAIDLEITNIRALYVEQTEQIVEAIAHADVMGSAVGVKNLIHIAPLVAAGITRRFSINPTPLDIYLCENMLDAASQLQSHVLDHLEQDLRAWSKHAIGFVGTSVARMVPVVSEELRKQHPTLVIADSYHKFPYDGTATKATQPPIEGMYPVKNFKAEVERKLFMYNLGHAALAYLGYLRGFSYVHETFDDREFISVFQQALDETGTALQKLYPDDIDAKSQENVRADINLRFSNPMMMDTIQRVGRDPLRKLGVHDRLVGSANLCLSQGIFPQNIAMICAAALCYDEPHDPQAVKLQHMISALGIETTLRKVSSLESHSELGRAIIQQYQRFQEQRPQM